MTIDWSQPIELDDGRPAWVERESENGRVRCIRSTGNAGRNKPDWSFEERGWWYTRDGVFSGGNAREWLTVRNANNEASFIPEDWS